MQPKTITLRHPVVHGAESITELTFSRAVKGKDLRGLPLSMGFEHLLILAGRLCGQPPSVMEQLEGEDLLTVVETAGVFFAPGRPTGETV